MSTIKSDSEQQKEDWMNTKWRPMMGWMYTAVCAFDFIFAPILWSLLQAMSEGSVQTQWQPLTLQGAGLFHLAMGAVLGITAYGRTQEKLNGATNGGFTLPSNVGTTYIPPGSINQTATGFDYNTTSRFTPNSTNEYSGERTNNSIQSTISSAPTITGFRGKKAPIPDDEPLI
jgi:hypothetical protein